jgi:hypothetical protein
VERLAGQANSGATCADRTQRIRANLEKASRAIVSETQGFFAGLHLVKTVITP